MLHTLFIDLTRRGFSLIVHRGLLWVGPRCQLTDTDCEHIRQHICALIDLIIRQSQVVVRDREYPVAVVRCAK